MERTARWRARKWWTGTNHESEKIEVQKNFKKMNQGADGGRNLKPHCVPFIGDSLNEHSLLSFLFSCMKVTQPINQESKHR